jgi:hypothetical protein
MNWFTEKFAGRMRISLLFEADAPREHSLFKKTATPSSDFPVVKNG